MANKKLEEDLKFLKKTLTLAKRGIGRVSPNPLVGAVIVKNGKIIASGYHKAAGEKHAEIVALDKAGIEAKGATLYVNLEPCSHIGKTGPCCDEIIKAGIKRVVFSVSDPNPLVNGKGEEKLKKAGIKVSKGLLEKEANELNEVFFKFISKKMPFVIMKSASSLDGKIATSTGESKWITSIESRRFVHNLRASVDALLIGSNTLKKDNPLLDTRLIKAKKLPAVVIVNTNLTSNMNAEVFKSTDKRKVFIATAVGKSKRKQIEPFYKMNIDIIFCKKFENQIDLNDLMTKLAEKNITSVMIEGGGEINASALKQGIIDKFFLFFAPILIGGNNAKGFVGGSGIKKLSEAYKMDITKIKRIGRDILIVGKMS
ncbi:MAG: bifunctional diaminohydroxyphosphoribosylaminopyrimidine deaminase/5-amino-6-(5-phosphoribosylamino)uracil reductase RibD [Candidatus Schekmanbacteria bacterium]|nr:MAG: bifunctional diaminohydroxyphosphoribosylaminopyrimidine deaminase/5-amino-6-(5-phosphoribosylamino)uracil reductase RibD [Candidatus Schekmanbacteria bacterium]